MTHMYSSQIGDHAKMTRKKSTKLEKNKTNGEWPMMKCQQPPTESEF